MIAAIAFMAGGFALLIVGGDRLVDGAIGLAGRWRMSGAFVGATIIGFGTSSAELAVSIQAAAQHSAAVSVANVVGSNIANVLLVLGLAACVSLVQYRRSLALDLGAMLVSGLLLALLAWLYPTLNLPVGIGLLVLLCGYLVTAWRIANKAPTDVASNSSPELAGPVRSGLLCSVGLTLLMAGAWLTVEGAVQLSSLMGISERVVGLTVIAVGTSLPELFATLAALVKRQPAMALGNVLGSNVFNTLGILGIVGMVSETQIHPEFARFDFPVMLACYVLLFVVFRLTRRWSQGLLLLGGYACYVAVLLTGG